MAAVVDPEGPKLCVLPDNPVPEGARAGYFTTPDKIRIRYAVFPKTAGAARGTVCLVQGRTEYIEKYFETVADFQKRGFAVATLDWRGQGGSDRQISAGYRPNGSLQRVPARIVRREPDAVRFDDTGRHGRHGAQRAATVSLRVDDQCARTFDRAPHDFGGARIGVRRDFRLAQTHAIRGRCRHRDLRAAEIDCEDEAVLHVAVR